ncbi:hypothetical protein J4D99_17295 [Siccationidurans ginsengisoli]|nr:MULTISPECIES: S41 family peptidase [unclassified Hymenobacter]MBO2033157.1 hypothetical protein [Hymenobacter sp. BT559]
MKTLLFLLLLQQLAYAQAPAACGCSQNFAEARRLLETNYSGYRDKVTAATKPRLDSLTRVLQLQADAAGSASACQQVLQQYLQFFRDGHVQLSSNSSTRLNNDSIRAYYANTERLPWTRASFRKYLDDPSRPKKPLEGIWRDGDGGGYEIGIVSAGAAGYQGVVLKADSIFWVPGQVKFTFTDPEAGPAVARYYMRNHNLESRPVRVVSDGELLINGPWYRSYPRPVPMPPAPAPFSFRMLDDTTALYRIASFNGYLRPKIDSITKVNAANLAHTKLLIIDVRGNGGGSDGSYGSLIPYLYTNPVKEASAAIFSTPENNSTFSGPMLPGTSASEKKYYAALKQRLDKHPGELVSMAAHGKTYTIHQKRSHLHPEVTRVAVLQNHFCASTTEQFLLLARQSKKTTTFGENSAGVLDYSNVHSKSLPCYNLRLGWAISRSFRIDRGEGIDNVGLTPTVRLDPTTSDMVEQVRAWYRQRK